MARGQVWLETVIYTLVGLALIGLVLGIVTPRINSYRDRAVIEQSITLLNDIDSVINAISSNPGNARIVDVRLKSGTITVDALQEKIEFFLDDSSVLYSEPGVITSIGRIKVITEEAGSKKTVRLTLNYQNESDIVIDSGDQVRTYTAAPTPYRFRFENQGIDPATPDSFYRIDFREVSSG